MTTTTPQHFALTGVSGYVAPRHLKAIRDTGNLSPARSGRVRLGAPPPIEMNATTRPIGRTERPNQP